jgi:hypothetical protein
MTDSLVFSAQETMAEPRKNIDDLYSRAQNSLQELNRLANHVLNGGGDPNNDIAGHMGALSAQLHYLEQARRRLN